MILSSGAGLGGALSAVDAVLAEKSRTGKAVEIHLYYGLRNVDHLPYRKRLEELASSGSIKLTLVVSGGTDCNKQLEGIPETEPGIRAAVQRGEVARTLPPSLVMKEFLPSGSRAYTQHIVGLDLTSERGSLRTKDMAWKDTAFVICGRIEILHDTFAILQALSSTNEPDNDLVSDRVFTNI